VQPPEAQRLPGAGDLDTIRISGHPVVESEGLYDVRGACTRSKSGGTRFGRPQAIVYRVEADQVDGEPLDRLHAIAQLEGE